MTSPSDTSQESREIVSSKIKKSEKQIYVILLLITFAFLILATPAYILFFYTRLFDLNFTGKTYASFYLLQQIAQKTYVTNNGINFFLYVLSGSKFRKDVLMLFGCCKCSEGRPKERGLSRTTTDTNISKDQETTTWQQDQDTMWLLQCQKIFWCDVGWRLLLLCSCTLSVGSNFRTPLWKDSGLQLCTKE